MSGMTGHDLGLATAENYRRFARYEAAGRSSAYQLLAEEVAADQQILGFLGELPLAKRQPNLLFAAARYLLGSPPEPRSLRALVTERPSELSQCMRIRRTQTNEAARCATLLPALASIPGPLALLEVGAAAGLTLLVDCYSYDYDGHQVVGTDPGAPVLSCRTSGPVPMPTHVPDVPWRAGLDLNPLDVDDVADMEWLSCLVWPDQPERESRLSAAVATAQRHRPLVRRGDLLDDLVEVAAQAPGDATLVIYHSAVLAYISEERRREFAEAVGGLGAVWLSNEGPGVVPGAPVPPEGLESRGFALVQDGKKLLACADGHGAWLEWLA